MLPIRAVVDAGRYDVLVLPVRPGIRAGTAGGGQPGAGGTAGAAELVSTAWVAPVEARAAAAALLPTVDLSGAPGTTYVSVRPDEPVGRLVLLGIGDGVESDWRAAGAALARCGALVGTVAVSLPTEAGPDAVRGVSEGLWLASYRFRLPPADEAPAADASSAGVARSATGKGGVVHGPDPEAVLLVGPDPAAVEETLTAARVTASTTRLARDLTNMPASVKSPGWLAERIVAAAAGHPGLTARVRGPDWLAAEGFGGVLAVGGGSVNPPRLVELAWRPETARTHVVLVGKGVTFDTGGLSIKPHAAMTLMRKDMGGAAAVMAATIGAAELRLPVRITALAPLAENSVSGAAFRPGDVIRHYGGMTSETSNTDAEGRLLVADALGYARDRLAPDLLVDLATLTGANAVALGARTAALYSDNDKLAAAVLTACAAAGELAWRMPLPNDYREYLHSELADLDSAPLPAHGAGSILPALYLREFAGELRDRWLHIDMSAPSWAGSDSAELVKGATGWGVRTLLRWLATL